MYTIGDRIVHPMHGAGVVDDIVTQRSDGIAREYYVFRAPMDNIVVLIPVGSSDGIGVRPVVERAAAQALLDAYPTLHPEANVSWNRRYRDNMLRIKSGDLTEVAVVVKSLMLRGKEHTLSTGERKMLTAAKRILLSELSLALDAGVDVLDQKLDAML
ncbi:MAG: CarD family transcriptional regulator [Clostridiaceae bacterium]|nr:CarD family transcriptional regulator [Clostridiaceae bacterium]